MLGAKKVKELGRPQKYDAKRVPPNPSTPPALAPTVRREGDRKLRGGACYHRHSVAVAVGLLA